MAEESTNSDPKSTSPKKFNGPKDARSDKDSGQYPNYYSHRSRSGHAWTMDDSKGKEHITLQHRGGSMLQFKPDGSIQLTAHNGQYNMVFGENRMKITGAYDVVVNGGGSLKVDGDYNCTVKGKANFAVNGDLNFTAKNINTTARGNIETAAQNMTTRAKGNMEVHAEGSQKISADQSVNLVSNKDSVSIQGQQSVAFSSVAGEAVINSGKQVTLKGGTVGIESATGAVGITAKTGFDAKGATVKIESSGEGSFKMGGTGKISSGSILHLRGATFIKAGPNENKGSWDLAITNPDEADGASPVAGKEVEAVEAAAPPVVTPQE